MSKKRAGYRSLDMEKGKHKQEPLDDGVFLFLGGGMKNLPGFSSDPVHKAVE